MAASALAIMSAFQQEEGKESGPFLEDSCIGNLCFHPFGQILVTWPPPAPGEAKEMFSLFQAATYLAKNQGSFS